jgi:Spy/CpxP family protein refolding chaperone
MNDKPTDMKHKVRLFSIFLASCIFLQVMNAQGRKDREEQIEKFRSMKIAFYTERLELTTEEAEKFWPLYNEYEKNRHEISRHRHPRPRDMEEHIANLSDQEALQEIDEMMEARKKEVKLAADFLKDMKAVLPPKKILRFYITEVQFREYMLRRIRDEHRGHGGEKGENPPPGSKLP